MPLNRDFLRWEVKPLWIIRYPSILTGADPGTQQKKEIYGVNRTVGDIVRNWEKIHSIEQFNQGFVAKPTDITFTIGVKEHGSSFELLRRLSKGAILFDIECSLVDAGSEYPNDNVPTPTTPLGLKDWMDGFERFVGCVVNRDGFTIDIAEFPIREMECLALRHQILDSVTLTEGDGTYPETNAKSKADTFAD